MGRNPELSGLLRPNWIDGVSSIRALAAFAVALSASPVLAGFTTLGSTGWRAVWDASLDGQVQINVDAESPDGKQVFIEKSAQFDQGPDAGGLFPTITVTFQQIGPSVLEQIIINDEIILNNTGHPWTDFHMDVVDGGDAAFNSTLTNASNGGDGFITSPFDNQMFGGPLATFDGQPTTDHFMEFWVDGFGLAAGGANEIIPPFPNPNSLWLPGGGAFDGQLFIDVVSDPSLTGPGLGTSFTLKETPTFIPEPATTGMLILSMLAASALGRRR